MTRYLKQILVVLCCSAGFLWGLKQDAIQEAWANFFEPGQDTPSSIAENDPTITSSSTNGVSPTTGKPATAGTSPSPDSARAIVVSKPPPPAGSFAETYEAIRPGAISEGQRAQRNEFFDQLSQQMKGEQAGGAGAPATPDFPNLDAQATRGNPGVELEEEEEEEEEEEISDEELEDEDFDDEDFDDDDFEDLEDEEELEDDEPGDEEVEEVEEEAAF